MIKLSVFIPVYNEESCLEDNITKLYRFLNKLKYSFEILIVDDTSNDSTPAIADKLRKKYGSIKFIRYENGPSRRENLARSFPLSKGDIIAFMDADMSTDLNFIAPLIKGIADGNDIVIGSKYLEESRFRRGFNRYLISAVYNNLIKFLFNSKIRDHQCGFKAFRRPIALSIIKSMGYDKSFTRGWFWDAEFLIRAQKKNLKILEIPIIWGESNKSTFNFFREIKIIPHILNIRFKCKTI